MLMKKAKKAEKIQKPSKKRKIIIFIILLLLVAGGTVAALYFLKGKTPEEIISVITEDKKEPEPVHYYDNLTGEEIASEDENKGRINCIQIPNGTDARPQVGLHDAKIVYEAIAEGGITRFAALYRNSDSDVIGPVRSLRMYYLEWDLPYDCTIVHAGGVKAAVQRAEKYAHLSESATYMWRDYSAYYAPNNLFTSPALLEKFNNSKGYTTSSPKTFPRMTPKESEAEREEIKGDTEAKYTAANSIYVHITTAQNYNVKYTYDADTNSYLRAYEGKSGKHMSYTCKNTGKSGNKIKPQKDCGAATQLAPKVVVVMKVPEELNSDNHYREEIATTGSGDAWIFQNGIAIEATWSRKNDEAGLEFKDRKTGNEIKLAPGQTWITAVAKRYGYVKY